MDFDLSCTDTLLLSSSLHSDQCSHYATMGRSGNNRESQSKTHRPRCGARCRCKCIVRSNELFCQLTISHVIRSLWGGLRVFGSSVGLRVCFEDIGVSFEVCFHWMSVREIYSALLHYLSCFEQLSWRQCITSSIHLVRRFYSYFFREVAAMCLDVGI